MLRDLGQDVRFALRMLWKQKSFTLLALAALALGIGANSALFSVVNVVLLRPLPFANPDRLVMVWTMDPRLRDGRTPVAPADFDDWRAQTRSFSQLAASSDAVFNLTGGGEPEMIIGYAFAPEMFSLLGVSAARGRTFTAGDGDHVVVLSDALWRRRFGADPGVMGTTVSLDHESYRVLGVMPPNFQHPGRTQLWVPLALSPKVAHTREARMLRVMGRLAPGVSIAQARAEMRALAGRQAAAWPDTNRNRDADVETLRHWASGDIEPVLLVLFGAVAFVLLLAVSNVAGLLLARAHSRQREISIRAALGASRSRIVRQLLTESVILALWAGALGLLVALWGTSVLVRIFPQKIGNVAIPRLTHIPIDGAVLGFTLLVSLVSGLLFGAIPALAASRTDLETALRESGRGTSVRGARLRRLLVAGEIAFAVVLVAGAALMSESFGRLAAADLGFEGTHVASGRVILGPPRWEADAAQQRFVADVLVRLRAMPGITQAGAISTLPLSGWWSDTSYFVEGGPPDELNAAFNVVDLGYFATMRIPLVAGRLFDARDRAEAPAVIVVDQGVARRSFPGGDAVGRRFNFGTAAKPEWRTIIGVVGAVKDTSPALPARPTIYVPFAQRAWPLIGFVARTNGDPATAAVAIRDAVWATDAEQPVSYLLSLGELQSDVLAPARVSMIVLGAFALLALGLAALGVYGMMAFAVAQRRQEIGIRMALGARPGDVVRMVLRQALTVSTAGVLVGLPAALVLARTLSGLLYGVRPGDPLTFVAVALLLGGVAVGAAWRPARRAAGIDPATALRAD
jgi:putative ABC transport system permease protein